MKYPTNLCLNDEAQEQIVEEVGGQVVHAKSREAGVGKYTLKVRPAYAASDQWSLASGYWRFGISAVIGISRCHSGFSTHLMS